MTGWREDIVWGRGSDFTEIDSPKSSPRPEIGHRVFEREEEGYWVLDNRGQWSPFAVELD